MFKVGDQIIYSVHGLCIIDDICEETVSGVTQQYYKLHPLENGHRMTISTPVNNDKVVMLALLTKEEAIEIIDSFNFPGIGWEEDSHLRSSLYRDIVLQGDRKEIAKVINTLKRKNIESKQEGSNLQERDQKILNTTQSILFKELALTLEKPYGEVMDAITASISKAPQVA